MNSFLQSKHWEKFQQSLGRKTWRINGLLIIEHKLPFKKSYLYSPRCGGDFLSEQFLQQIKNIAKKENSIFLKLEPTEKPEKIDKKNKFKQSTNIQPRKSLILDITKPEKELLEQMHHKTRYNIRLARRKGVKVKSDKTKFEYFWKLLQKTTERDQFKAYPQQYYQRMLDIPGLELFVAIYNQKVIAANIVLFYNQTAIYLHGTSDYKYRKLMAPHLLQWEQIRKAKKQSCIEYDFWGIDQEKWPGVTRFKTGFCKQNFKHCLRVYPSGYDLIFKFGWYQAYKLIKKFK